MRATTTNRLILHPGDKILHNPEMGDFDLVIGSEIVFAFAGAADFLSFNLVTHINETNTVKATISKAQNELNNMYRQVRVQRESGAINVAELLRLFETLKSKFSQDWLLSLEIFELTQKDEILEYLEHLKQSRPEVAHLITNGIELIK